MEFEEDYSECDYSESNYQQIDSVKREDAFEEEKQDILFQKTDAYRIMDLAQTEKYIQDLVNDLIETWGIPESTAIRLLKKFEWDQVKASDNLAEETNLETLEHGNNSEEFDCGICFMTELRTNGYSFGCNHYDCKDCFEEYIKTAINDGQPFKSCPTEGCKEVLAPKLCFDLFGQNEEIYSKYKRYLLQNIVDTSYNLLWCSGMECQNTIQLLKLKKSDRTLLNIRCPCGYCFCFACRNVAHRPLKCDQFAKWKVNVGKEDVLNDAWIQENSKPCPRCLVSIEKNYGCMHMTCTKCHFEFCWLCMGSWKEHTYENMYQCESGKKPEVKLSKKQKEYDNFYRERFGQHWNVLTFSCDDFLQLFSIKALKFAIWKKKIILENFKFINDESLHKEDNTFLVDALDLIIDARRAISMTYVAAEYRKSIGLRTDIFEVQQSLLWAALDHLDKFTDPLQQEVEMDDILVDFFQGKRCWGGKFHEYKIHLKSMTEGVVSACNKLLISMERDNDEFPAEIPKELVGIPEEDEIPFEIEYWECHFCEFKNEEEFLVCRGCYKAREVDLNLFFENLNSKDFR